MWIKLVEWDYNDSYLINPVQYSQYKHLLGDFHSDILYDSVFNFHGEIRLRWGTQSMRLAIVTPKLKHLQSLAQTATGFLWARTECMQFLRNILECSSSNHKPTQPQANPIEKSDYEESSRPKERQNFFPQHDALRICSVSQLPPPINTLEKARMRSCGEKINTASACNVAQKCVKWYHSRHLQESNWSTSKDTSPGDTSGAAEQHRPRSDTWNNGVANRSKGMEPMSAIIWAAVAWQWWQRYICVGCSRKGGSSRDRITQTVTSYLIIYYVILIYHNPGYH